MRPFGTKSCHDGLPNGLNEIPELVSFLSDTSSSFITDSTPKFDSMLNDLVPSFHGRSSMTASCCNRHQDDFMEYFVLMPPDLSEESHLCLEAQSPEGNELPSNNDIDAMLFDHSMPFSSQSLALLWDQVSLSLDHNSFQNEMSHQEPTSRTRTEQAWPRPPPRRFFEGSWSSFARRTVQNRQIVSALRLEV
jgi:hypothetical protein